MIITGQSITIKRWMLEQLLTRRCKIALYSNAASLGPQTQGYTADGEVNGKGYRPGGETLLGGQVVSTPTGAAATWALPKWINATMRPAGAMIYIDDLPGKPVIMISSFGSERIVENANFSMSAKTFPIELN